ncbi:hypothetical protein KEG38_43270 [Polyangium jinanense]|uniref:hypothetical protein n=1 Tax=Polyangium jinanense TaxID=2829994 RepID=UPI0023420BCF|nr:hypothetical protein [Polyangium jinanense]MDC3960753.1 hypothetical protein [Polyangium jinanense]
MFTEARQLLDAGRAPEACPKLEESQRLDPAVGTALNLADCYERTNRTASAYITFEDAAALARRTGDTARAEEAERRAQALQPKLVRLAVNVPEPHRIPGLTILRDGQPLPQAQWGTPVPVDPGEHVVEAKAPDRTPWKKTVQLTTPGTVEQLAVPLLGEVERPPPPGRTAQRVAGIVVGSVGLAGLAVAGGLSIAAVTTDKESKQYCPEDPNKCYPRGVALRNEAIMYADTATVVVIASGVVVATGVTLFLLAGAPKSPNKTARTWVLAPHASPQGAGLVLGGVF